MTSQTECAINFSTGFGTPPSLWAQHSNQPIRFPAAGRRVIGKVSGKAALSVQANALVLAHDAHPRIGMTHIIDQLVGGILNGNRFGTVMVRLKDVDNHSVGERPFATAVIHHAARGDKTHRTAL